VNKDQRYRVARIHIKELEVERDDVLKEAERLEGKLMTARIKICGITKERNTHKHSIDVLLEKNECLERKLGVAMTVLKSVARGNHNAKYEAKQALKQIEESEVQG